MFRVWIALTIAIAGLFAHGEEGEEATVVSSAVTWQSGLPARATLAGFDWTAYRKNLREVGYNDAQIATDFIDLIYFHPEHATQIVRTALDRPQWDWEDGLSEDDYQALLREPSRAEYLLGSLGLWAEAFPRFDAVRLVRRYLHNHPEPMPAADAVDLMAWKHLWIRSPHGSELAFQLLMRLPTPSTAGWILDQFTGKERELLGAKVRNWLAWVAEEERGKGTTQFAESLFEFSSYIPQEFQPANMHDWASGYGWPAQQLRRQFPTLKSDQVQLIHRGTYHAGTCGSMSTGHIGALGILETAHKSPFYQQTVVIRLQGQVVGAVKTCGDVSMMGLTNIVDSKGRAVVQVGGVYRVTRDLAAVVQRLPLRSGWNGLDVESLQLKPLSVLLNETAWTTRFAPELFLAGGDAQWGSHLSDPVFHRAAWVQVAGELDCFRLLVNR